MSEESQISSENAGFQVNWLTLTKMAGSAYYSLHSHQQIDIHLCKICFINCSVGDSEMEKDKKLSNNALKRKYKNPTIEEDPLQFHAKPKDLSVNASDMPAEVAKNTVTELIFSRSPFSSFALEPKLISLLENPLSQNGLAIKTCTTVQNVVIPTMLEKRRNMLIKSQTGSGKTLSYLVPVVNDLMQLGAAAVSRNDGSRALIIAPTRELCAQIADVLAKITQCCVWIVGGSITGGEKKKSEKARLRKGVVVLVATPGRLLDHIKTTESFNLTKLRWVVMDEADRLLDMGTFRCCGEIDCIRHLSLTPAIFRFRTDGTGDSESHPRREPPWSEREKQR